MKRELWSHALPNEPTTVVELGMSQRLVHASPDAIPSTSVPLLNAPSAVVGFEAVGAPRVFFRNVAAYPFKRPDTSRDWYSMDRHANYVQNWAARQLSAFDKRFKDNLSQLHPETRDHIETEILNGRANSALRSARQGNALATHTTSAHQVLWTPSGELMQHIQCFRRESQPSHRSKAKRWIRYAPTTATTNPIRQLEALGDPNVPAVVARGDANATIAALSPVDNSVQIVETLRFNHLLEHVACSPHTLGEAMFIAQNREFLQWTSEGGLRSMGPPVQEQWTRAVYSSHPCVLWVAATDTIGTLDTRQASPACFNRNWIYNSRGATTIYDVKRHPSCPFQYVVRTGLSLEVFDTRSSSRSVVHWSHTGLFPEASVRCNIKEPITGPLDIVDVSSGTKNQALLLSGTSVLNKVTVHSYHVASSVPSGSEVLRPLLASSLASQSQAGVDMAPFDVHLPDTSPSVHLVGVAGLFNAFGSEKHGASCVDVFQVSSTGDVFCQTLMASNATQAAVQAELACGMTVRATDRDASLPIPFSAFLPEHDAESRLAHVRVDQEKLRAALVARAKELSPTISPSDELLSLAVLRRHFRVVKPSCTLRTLRDTWVDLPKVHVLLASLRASDGFHLQRVHPHNRGPHTRVRVRPAESDVKPSLDDAACHCTNKMSDVLELCAGDNCVLLDAIVVRRQYHDNVKHEDGGQAVVAYGIPTRTKRDEKKVTTNVNGHDFVLADLRAVYGRLPDSASQYDSQYD
ncbi:hypothetical protein SDRG_13293 [Saprolegnia diclina VS20]|uniref:Uncharacterized protein n=1 Tax=Saprolegnia diclina (strain VS20) TaxID=1156394 RepID=T0Q348_SAPDV|nr:hypothetical protein SDRG_13293 [Saprolegnia diclina VS20]EQC28956.1 hypothetical protein SDRG_13293 [Saprolegnia diclina VS20]|eukprot:XP_008617595.1 hypothetical protein SDRG_13293 [Saprolegnia diclina VS20]